MGNNPSRNSTYEKYYNSISSNPGAELDMDPYEVFGLSKNFEWEELKNAYRRVAKLVHPDKGGSEILFHKVSDAFKILAQEYKNREADKQYGDLKNGYKDYVSNNFAPAHKQHQQETHPSYPSYPSQLPRGSVSTAGGSDRGDRGDLEFLDRFNRTFEENRFEDDEYGNSVGYGDIMEKSSKIRGDIAIPKVMNKFNSNDFNKKFDENVTNMPIAGKQVIKYAEPQALPLAKSIQYTELGGDRPSDFSSTNEGVSDHRGLQYSDYLVAHSTSRLIDPGTIKSRKEYRSVSEYEKTRDKIIKKPPTEEELRSAARQKELDKRKEEERLRKLKERDQKISEHHDRVNRLLIR